MKLHFSFPAPVRAPAFARAGASLLALAALAACTSTPLPPMPPMPPMRPATPAAPQPAPLPMPARPIGAQPAAPVVTGPRLFVPPSNGARVSRFDGAQNKGLDFAGRTGDPVMASRAGRVVLVSGALPAYGTMVVVKHDDEFITAYAQLGKPLVREGDDVQQGQTIAEMGPNTINNRIELHFEVRRQGNAVDPEPFLDGTAR